MPAPPAPDTRAPGVRSTPPPQVAGARRVHVGLRLVGALLLVASGAEHLELSLAGGYGSIPTIGLLFVLQAAAAFALAVVVLATRHPLASLGGAVFAMATLGGYLISLSGGLFGFHEVVTAPGIASGAMEIAAFAVLAWVGTSTGRAPLGKFFLSSAAPRAVVLPLALAAGFAFALSIALAPASVSATGGGDVVTAITIPGYGSVLATGHSDTLYVLQSPTGAPVPCRGSCVALWPPLLVAGPVGPVHAGDVVRGKLGTVDRDGARQLTFNGYPLYTYAGDTGPRETNGEKVVSFGGTWYLVRASATRASTTAVKRRR